jgi:hypothetical protein
MSFSVTSQPVDLTKISAHRWLSVRRRLQEQGKPAQDEHVRQVFEEAARKEAEYAEMHRKRCQVLPLAAGIWEVGFESGKDGDIELRGKDTGIIYFESSEQLREYGVDLLKLADQAQAAGF